MRVVLMALCLAGTVAAPALAHPDGHDQQYRAPQRKPISQSAQEAVVKLVTQAKLPASWAKVQASNVTPPSAAGGRWQVTFQNKAIRARGKQVLYVLMTPEGEFVSASHKKA